MILLHVLFHSRWTPRYSAAASGAPQGEGGRPRGTMRTLPPRPTKSTPDHSLPTTDRDGAGSGASPTPGRRSKEQITQALILRPPSPGSSWPLSPSSRFSHFTNHSNWTLFAHLSPQVSPPEGGRLSGPRGYLSATPSATSPASVQDHAGQHSLDPGDCGRAVLPHPDAAADLSWGSRANVLNLSTLFTPTATQVSLSQTHPHGSRLGTASPRQPGA